MKLVIEKVDIIGIDRKQAFELRNEIISLAIIYKKDYPRLGELYLLLTNSFETQTNGIHFIKENLK